VRQDDQAELRDQRPKGETTVPPQPHRILNASGMNASYKGVAAVGIDNTGRLQSIAQVGMNDRLSRGGDNAKERGVGAQFP